MKIADANTGEIIGQSKEQSLTLVDDKFKFMPHGLEVVGDPTFDDWMACGRSLRDVKQGLHFAIGDWLIYGRDRWPDRYAQGMAIFGFAYQTLSTDVWVAEGFPRSRRRKLPHSYHREVRALPAEKQDEVLDKAEKGKWDRQTIRAKVREIRNPEPRNRARRIREVQMSCDLLYNEWDGKVAIEFTHTDGGSHTYCPGWKSLYRLVRVIRSMEWRCQPLDTYGIVGWIVRKNGRNYT